MPQANTAVASCHQPLRGGAQGERQQHGQQPHHERQRQVEVEQVLRAVGEEARHTELVLSGPL